VTIPGNKCSNKILFITDCWPHADSFGGQLRALHVGRALQKLGRVTLTVVSADNPMPETVEKTAAEFDLEPAVRVVEQPNRGLGRVQWALNARYLNVHGCVTHSADRERLLNRSKQFDLVWLLNSRTPNILQQWRWPNSVLDVSDVPSTFLRSMFQNGAGALEKVRAGAQMLLARRRERLWKERFDLVSVCSEADRQYLGAGGHIHVIPNGFEISRNQPVRRSVQPPRLGFIGLYSYPPNLEGMRWFIRECWPRIRREIPQAKLRLAGKDTNGVLKPMEAGVEALGWLADPAAEIATWSAMIVPVRHGAGTRVKIADAFSRKCPVVSTNLGAFGYEAQHGRELLLADGAGAFAEACISLIKAPELGRAMAERAYRAFLEKWTWDAIAPKVWGAAETVLKTK
jgi:polysaccharide biosynthesis protein PslH